MGKQLPPVNEQDVRDRLVLDNLRLVGAVWVRWGKRDHAVAALGEEEAIAAGNLGLLRAAGLYDGTRLNPATGKPYAFSTMAWRWIVNAMQHAAWRSRSDPEALIFSQLGDGTRGRFEDSIPAPQSGASDCGAVLEVLGRLEPRLGAVLRLRYLEGLTLVEVAERMGLTKERVRQLGVVALGRLRCAVEGLPPPDETRGWFLPASELDRAAGVLRELGVDTVQDAYVELVGRGFPVGVRLASRLLAEVKREGRGNG